MPRGQASHAHHPPSQRTAFIRNVVPDRLDLRDRSYQPTIQINPGTSLKPRQWNERLEKMLAAPGSMIWGEMKQNADAITALAEAGGIKLYQACQKSPFFKDKHKVRLHLIGHSAGSILHSHLIERLSKQGWSFGSVNFMAPTMRVDTFTDKVVPAIKDGRVKRYHQFHLTDAAEQKDPSCKPILGYSRSLLYLVSQSFEQGKTTPILGMEKYFDAKLQALPNVRTWAAPCKESQSVEHGGFDDDKATRESVVGLIRGED